METFLLSILLEDSHDWFDMGSLKESPYMMYAIPVREEKKNIFLEYYILMVLVEFKQLQKNKITITII